MSLLLVLKYSINSDNYLNMKRGDRLIKLDEEESEALHLGLVQVKLKGVEGLVPANYVQPLTISV